MRRIIDDPADDQLDELLYGGSTLCERIALTEIEVPAALTRAWTETRAMIAHYQATL